MANDYNDLSEDKKKELLKDLWYWTRYADGYSNEGFYAEVEDVWSSLNDELDWDAIQKALKEGGNLPYRLNLLVYEAIWNPLDYDWDSIVEVQYEYNTYGFEGLSSLVDVYVDEAEAYTVDTWEDLINDNLKAEGLYGWAATGSVIDDFNKMHEGSLYSLNGYANGFDEVYEENIFYDYGGVEAVEAYISW